LRVENRLAPDSGEKLTLDITILLSLVFYLQLLSNYIPRGYSQIPILTLFTLINFSMVFISCVITIFVLRLYYKPFTYLTANNHQLPYALRVLFFKYLAKIMCFDFYFRKKDEFYTKHHHQCQHHHQEGLMRFRSSRASSKENSSGKNMELMDIFTETTVSNCTRRQNRSFRRSANNESEEFENFDWAEPLRNLSENEKSSQELRTIIKLLNTCINNNKTIKKSNSLNYSKSAKALRTEDKSLYYEEWKQVAIIIDRIFFFVFIITMPMTILIFFMRVDVKEYLNTEPANYKTVPNLC
jgi:hypothetical protein